MVRRSAPALPRPDRSPDRGVEPGGRLLGTVMGTRREYLHYTHRECERYAKPCGRRHGTTLSAAAAACGRRAGLPSHTVAQPGPTCKCDYTSRRVAHSPRRRPEGAGARRSVRFARGRPLRPPRPLPGRASRRPVGSVGTSSWPAAVRASRRPAPGSGSPSHLCEAAPKSIRAIVWM